MNLAQKHHYLPRFYLKGFTNKKGFFYIYDCKSDRVNKREFHPNNIFYDDRNFIEVNGVKSDLPEQMYSVIDNRHSPLFKKIHEQKGPLQLDWQDKLTLLEFIVTIFGRLPSNEKLFENQLQSNIALKSNFKIVNKATGVPDQEMTDKIIGDAAFSKSIKAILPIITKYNKIDETEFSRWQFIYNPLGNNICSDSPIIFKDENPLDILDTDFVFPISNEHLLLRINKRVQGEVLPAPIMAYIQLLIFSQANFYSCSSDQDFLNKAHAERKNMLPTNVLFNILYNSEWLDSLNKEFLRRSPKL